MGALTYQIRRRWRLPQLQASMSTGLHLQCIDQRLDPSRVELRDRFVDHDRREVGRFRVEHGVLAIGVEQDFVETVETPWTCSSLRRSDSMACSRRVVALRDVSAETFCIEGGSKLAR